MKKYIILSLSIIFALQSCVEDEIFISDIDVVESTVTINEVLSTGDPDWIEIYNASGAEVDMSGYSIGDSGAEYTFENGTKIGANGHLVILCDDNDIVDAEGIHSNFKISSKGEIITLKNELGAQIDKVEVPALNPGISYGRTEDGGETWGTLSPTKGTENSNTNVAPVITAEAIVAINDNTAFEYTIEAVDASGIRDVKIFYQTETKVKIVEMAPVGNGEYSFIFPMMTAGETMEYYVVATDETGLKSYFPENAPDEKLNVTVTDGLPVFSNFRMSPENPTANADITIYVDINDISGMDEGRLYYTVNTDDAETKTKIVMDVDGSTYSATIPAQAGGAVVKYYMRGEDLNGNKAYFPIEEKDEEGIIIGDFDHDNGSTWPGFSLGDETIIPINGFSELEITGNAADGTTFNVNIKYDNGAVEEIKFYYIINYDAATYVADNDRHSFEWAGDLPTTDDFYYFTIPAEEISAGDKVIWYMRAKDGAGDKNYFTDGQDENFDKDVIADWNEITVQ